MAEETSEKDSGCDVRHSCMPSSHHPASHPRRPATRGRSTATCNPHRIQQIPASLCPYPYSWQPSRLAEQRCMPPHRCAASSAGRMRAWLVPKSILTDICARPRSLGARAASRLHTSLARMRSCHCCCRSSWDSSTAWCGVLRGRTIGRSRPTGLACPT